MYRRNTVLAGTCLAAALGLTFLAFADDVSVPLPEQDARSAAKMMQSSGTSLTRAIDTAEAHCNGKAVSAVCRANGNSSVIEICCLDAKDTFQLVVVDAGSGRVKSMERAQFRDYASSSASVIILKASGIMDEDVKNPQGEDLGEIEDLVIDPSRTRIVYAVLSFGGVLGVGEKLFAVPWSALSSQHGETYVLDVQKSQLEQLPSFDKRHWPDMNNLEWGRTIHSTYKVRPYWETDVQPANPPLALIRASEFINKKVTNAADEKLGEIEDLTVDSQNGRIVYAVLEFEFGGYLVKDKYFAVPWQVLAYTSEGKVLLNVPKERLKDAPGFDKKNWPDMADPEFGRTIHGYYGK